MRRFISNFPISIRFLSQETLKAIKKSGDPSNASNKMAAPGADRTVKRDVFTAAASKPTPQSSSRRLSPSSADSRSDASPDDRVDPIGLDRLEGDCVAEGSGRAAATPDSYSPRLTTAASRGESGSKLYLSNKVNNLFAQLQKKITANNKT